VSCRGPIANGHDLSLTYIGFGSAKEKLAVVVIERVGFRMKKDQS